jgi:hypothetical protein
VAREVFNGHSIEKEPYEIVAAAHRSVDRRRRRS